MKRKITWLAGAILFALSSFLNSSTAQQLTDYNYRGSLDVLSNTVSNDVQFNGYTNHWWNDYKKWYRYGSLYKIVIPDVERKIIQSRIDMAEDMNLPGLWMQEGFLTGWLEGQCTLLDNPSPAELSAAAAGGNVLVITSPASETGKILHAKYPGNEKWKRILKSYQFNDPFLTVIDAFILENGNRKIF
ncbi:MAG TPA: hypothetical protein PLO24_10255, partial [Bacteroidales bacterium]|nr:hypothetical protein [Bacteroidales bacterium]